MVAKTLQEEVTDALQDAASLASRCDDVAVLTEALQSAHTLRDALRSTQEKENEIEMQEEKNEPNNNAGGGGEIVDDRKNWLDFIGGFTVVVLTMIVAALFAHWFVGLWYLWIVNPWSKRELPMLLTTIALNALLNAETSRAASSSSGSQQPTGQSPEENERVLERQRHQKKVRQKLLDWFCAFRLVVGFPIWHVIVRLLTYWAVGTLGFREQFPFRVSMLGSALFCWNYSSLVLKWMLPIFFVNYTWLLGGNYFTAVVFFPWDLLWRSFDALVMVVTGETFIRGVLLTNLFNLVQPFDLKISEAVLTQPVCHDDPFAKAYASVYPESLYLVKETDFTCLQLTFGELYGLFFSFSGAFRISALLFLIWGAIEVNAWGIFLKWWKDRENTLDEVEKVIANRKRVLEYAKSNPFRAKLHADPREFLATKKESIKDSLLRMSKWNPTTSLRFRLGERAKTSTHVERVHALRKSLVDLHGEPDAYDLLFRKVSLTVTRGVDDRGRCVFHQVADHIVGFPMKKLKNGLHVSFAGEHGVDGGGLSAELYKLIAEELTEFENGDDNNMETKASKSSVELFRAFPDSTLMLAPNKSLDLVHYYALGRLVGLAILHETSFQLPLSSAMLKMMVDVEIDSEDVRAVDPTYFENRMLTLLQYGGVDLMKSVMEVDIPFVWMDSNGELGEELCPNGSQRILSEENKFEYIQLLSEHYICGKVREEMQIFLSGFHEVVPASLLHEHRFDHIDLALALQGVPEIDIEDWKTNTDVPTNSQSWKPVGDHEALRDGAMITTETLLDWFWASVEEMDPEKRARLLQFATGLSNTPVGGFRNLKPRKFNIVIDMEHDHLPTAMTCFNTLRLPAASSKSDLADRLVKVCSQRHLLETFGEK